MPQLSFSLLLIFSSLMISSTFSLLPDPDPAPLQQPLIAANSAPPSTIPAFPEQSDVSSSSYATSSCPLSLPGDLIRSISAACPAARPTPRCCPSLAASLYSAFAPAALSLPSSARAASLPLPDLPALPDDSETCAGHLEAVLRAKGVRFPRVNATCDVAYCFCGVRLRRLSCASAAGGGFVADEATGRWAATEATGRRLEEECRRPGVAGCSRCLRALNQLNTNASSSSNLNNASNNELRECQLMGLTWLLSENRTLYLPTATSVLRAFMAAGDAGHATCSLPLDEMPFAVGSEEINGQSLAPKSSSKISFALFLIMTIISSMIM